jgi:glycosyltransferase involved in cell wall biosynthesis
MNFFVTANTAGGGMGQEGMSGGDRIALACIHRWAQEGHAVCLSIGQSGLKVYDVKNKKNIKVLLTTSFLIKNFSYIRLFIFEILGLIGGCRALYKIRKSAGAGDVVYSSSDFWPDAIPAFFLKLLRPEITWVAGFYLFAPRPWSKSTPYKGKKRIVGLLYWLTQGPVYSLVKKYADMFFVTSQPDVDKFVSRARNKDSVFVVRGGVDIRPSEEYLRIKDTGAHDKKVYDACFIGRFHYQKGVLELIDIWQEVCREKKDARLAMMGNGPLENQVQEAIRRLGLERNIDLLGFKDGAAKYEIFKKSRIVVHPATYDSGGMAAAEAMAWALPGVSFDLEALKTYYPKGMAKVPEGDLGSFAREILKLLSDNTYYSKMADEARRLVVEDWDWEKRATALYSYVMERIL